jgi:uncharacterized membrane protein
MPGSCATFAVDRSRVLKRILGLGMLCAGGCARVVMRRTDVCRQTVLDVTTTLSIFVNAGLVAFTGTFAIDDTWAERIWLFILLSGGLLV